MFSLIKDGRIISFHVIEILCVIIWIQFTENFKMFYNQYDFCFNFV